MTAWMSELDSNHKPINIFAKDGTMVEFYDTYFILITPSGYRVKIDLDTLDFTILESIDNYCVPDIYNLLWG